MNMFEPPTPLLTDIARLLTAAAVDCGGDRDGANQHPQRSNAPPPRRVAVFESTSGGLVAACLLATPGASRFFISGSIVYTGRGAKRLLPPAVLRASGLMNQRENYASKAAYVRSKEEYTTAVARDMLDHTKADVVVCESGTTGPDFFIPGVDEGFTSVSVAIRTDSSAMAMLPQSSNHSPIIDSSAAAHTACVVTTKTIFTGSADRVQNMQHFAFHALSLLRDSLNSAAHSNASRHSKL